MPKHAQMETMKQIFKTSITGCRSGSNLNTFKMHGVPPAPLVSQPYIICLAPGTFVSSFCSERGDVGRKQEPRSPSLAATAGQ